MNSNEQSAVPKLDTSARPGIQAKITSAGRGIVEAPILTPHLSPSAVVL